MQCAHTFSGHARPHIVVGVESDGAVGHETARGRLTNVMQQRRQAQPQIRPGHIPVRAGFQVHGLLQHGQRVLINVLVAAVLIDRVL